jgi:poly(A) polymerase
MSAAERAARTVIARLHEVGHVAYFAGGCVRDWERGETPIEFDVASDATAAEVQALFPRTVPVGAQFGVVLVLIDGEPIEVASFRTDEPYHDGRRPSGVRAATPEEDAQRRDFTINGMFKDAISGEVLDFVGGRVDLAAGVIRAIGDPAARIGEDRLRMLRAVRFAARLGFTIEPQTLAAVRTHAAAIVSVSWERIGDEILRILTEGAARRGFQWLDETGLLLHVLPEIAAMKGVEQSPDYHPEGDVFTHTLLLLGGLPTPTTPELALAALLHDVSKGECAGRRPDGRITFYGHAEVGAERAVTICQRLRRSRQTWETVEWLVRHHLRIAAAPQMRRSTLRRFLAEPHIDALLELGRIDALASNGSLEAYEFCRRAQAELADEPAKPPPLVRGRDLLALGYASGPLFAEILTAVEERQLEGELTDRDAALEWVQHRWPR